LSRNSSKLGVINYNNSKSKARAGQPRSDNCLFMCNGLHLKRFGGC
jgi:hypothetical protein